MTFLALTVSNSSLFTPGLLRTHSFVFFVVHQTRNILLSPFISNLHPRVGHTMDVLSPFISATICPILRHPCNLSFQRGIFPNQLKHALVTPSLKKPASDPDTASSYRPISILSFISKLVERLVAKRFTSHVSLQRAKGRVPQTTPILGRIDPSPEPTAFVFIYLHPRNAREARSAAARRAVPLRQ